MVLTKQQAVEAAPLALREVADPQVGVEEVRVKVSVCAVCRTDIHLIEGDLTLHKNPVIPGHQIVGRVDQVGDGVTRLRLGQRVGIAWLRHVDGTCKFCRRGRENLCRDSRYTGYDTDGGYAEYAIVPEDFAYELPEGFDDEHVSPLLCGGLIGYRALQRAAVPERGRLLLVGFGSSAHLVIQLALHRGHEVYVVTRSEHHIRQAMALGASWAGGDFASLPEKADGAVLFAPSGKLVPPTLEALDRGGICSIAGIKDRLILYGCGDFLTDYEGISGYESFRDDLALMYFVELESGSGRLVSTRLVPMKMRRFRLENASVADAKWLRALLNRQSAPFGTQVRLTHHEGLILNWR